MLKELHERVDALEHQLQSGFSKDVEADLLVTKNELEIWERREATRLGQIAKKKWMAKGGQNTKYYHSVINQRRKQMFISKMRLLDGRVLDNPEEIHIDAIEFFQGFLTEPSAVERADLSSLIDASISKDEKHLLCMCWYF